MREFELAYKGLGRGLRRRSRSVRGEYGLTDCYNLVPREVGLEPYNPISMPFISRAVNWPFPQLLTLSKYHFLLDKGDIYSVDEDFNLTYLLYGPGWNKELWHVADFGTYAFMTNTAGFNFYDATTAVWKRSFNPTAAYPLMNTLCAFRGQCIGGGITSSWYDCDENSVIWSKIGSLDFTLDQMNLTGYQHMPAKGEVLCVKPLGKGIVIYGSTYIMFMYPAEQTFGFQQLAGYGISGREAVAGDLMKHAFIDMTGKLRVIDGELGIKELGFQEFFYPLLDEIIVATFNPTTDEFNFCTPEENFILTDKGSLASHLQSITSLGVVDGGAICMAQNLSDTTGRFATDSIDFNSRGQKTIQALAFAFDSDQDCLAAVDWRNNHKGSYVRGPFKPVNQEGMANTMVAGSDLRAVFYTPDYSATYVDSFSIKYKITDKRYLRGIYADQTLA